jgi:hypothetical protein
MDIKIDIWFELTFVGKKNRRSEGGAAEAKAPRLE